MDGDIVNIDVTVILDGWHGDTSRMYFVGERISVKARKLVDITYEAMMRGIAGGAARGSISARSAMQSSAMRKAIAIRWCAISAATASGACSMTRPRSCITAGRKTGGRDARRHVLHGRADDQRRPLRGQVLSDGWTAVTKDRSLSAQFEHTVGVTATGYEIFTISPAGLHRPPYDLSLPAENPRPGPDRP